MKGKCHQDCAEASTLLLEAGLTPVYATRQTLWLLDYFTFCARVTSYSHQVRLVRIGSCTKIHRDVG